MDPMRPNLSRYSSEERREPVNICIQQLLRDPLISTAHLLRKSLICFTQLLKDALISTIQLITNALIFIQNLRRRGSSLHYSVTQTSYPAIRSYAVAPICLIPLTQRRPELPYAVTQIF